MYHSLRLENKNSTVGCYMHFIDFARCLDLQFLHRHSRPRPRFRFCSHSHIRRVIGLFPSEPFKRVRLDSLIHNPNSYQEIILVIKRHTVKIKISAGRQFGNFIANGKWLVVIQRNFNKERIAACAWLD